MSLSIDTSNTDETIPVLIVGGSLVGLSTALFLAARGISTMVVERHQGSATHPRVAALSPRTMEIFHSVGIEQAIREVEPPCSDDSNVLVLESLVGEELDVLQEEVGLAATSLSPMQSSMIAQDVLEPVLREQASRLGAQLHYDTELLTFTQDAEGVTATIREQANGAIRKVRSRYMVAADGGQSTIRQQLGIDRHGPGVMFHIISITFTADIMDLFRQRHAVMCVIGNEVVQNAFLVPYAGSSARSDLYRLDFGYDPEEERLDDYTPERCLGLIQAAIGTTDIPIQFQSVLTYDLAAFISNRWQDGRVFLVGDAARVQPPTGGLGGNTGIAEAHNLAWKLAAALHGEAGSDLLLTYELERRPLADLTVEQMILLSQQRNTGSEAITVDPLMVNMGYRYTAGAFVAESNAEAPLLQQPDLWRGLPGTRANHLWIELAGEQVSILDLFGREWVLLAGSSGQSWLAAASQIAEDLHLPLRVYQIGPELHDIDDHFCSAYGVTETGATLVRPDGMVGWRAQQAVEDAVDVLARTFARLLSR